MATLERSTKSYRRDGSSGSVWDIDQRELRHCYSVGTAESSSSSSSGATETEPVYVRSSSLSALKLLLPKSVGQKFKGVLIGKSPPLVKSRFEKKK